ncbi:WS/DGAT/MGAT family O-acyltransferase [Capillimicrobium parvum]|uniref:Diacylglycerol O-acyltransferase n=1 Tax=Capillimicrobium parvum TaxID=2884022 RepID=A0A9E6XVH7_9ACTN|nr:wax ester/triacylglycerol synthase family O-acyltransferase [Capillimicrobium parvum]UGS35225.1 Putative diacylglycerol O-acyltransferase [Capillimicrobium parvum]
MRQLTSLDAQFLAIESPRTVGHVSGLAILDPSTTPSGTLDVADLSRLVSERLPLLPPMRWKLVNVPLGLDYPSWIEDPHFDLDFHVRDLALPPGAGDDKLAEQVARIVARPLDRSRPLWELYLIHGLPDGRVAMLTKIHHAVVDGVSGAEILTALLDPSPEGRDVPPPEPSPAEREPTEAEMLARGIANLPLQPLRALRAVPGTLPYLRALPGTRDLPGLRILSRVAQRIVPGPQHDVLEFPTAPAPITPFNGPISPHRRFAFGRLSLDAVKEIKNAYGFTVNDVVVSISAGAVRRWLMDHDALPAEPLLAMVPVSVRSPEQSGTFGNRVSVMVVPVATDEPDPRRRLERTHDTLLTAKDRHRALPADLLTDVTRFIPPAVAARAARTTLSVLAGRRPPLNLIISNVPGPRVPLFCAGARLEAHYPVSVITDGVGLNITVMSYLDHLDFGIVADREMVPDVWSMIEGLREELDELSRLTPRFWKAPAPRRSARRRPPRATSPAGSPPADRS